MSSQDLFRSGYGLISGIDPHSFLFPVMYLFGKQRDLPSLGSLSTGCRSLGLEKVQVKLQASVCCCLLGCVSRTVDWKQSIWDLDCFWCGMPVWIPLRSVQGLQPLGHAAGPKK